MRYAPKGRQGGRGLLEIIARQSTADRAEQELLFQRRLAASLMATKGFASQEVEQACARMRELCERLGETRQLVSVLPIVRVSPRRSHNSRRIAHGN